MKLFANRKVALLFKEITLWMLMFALASALFAGTGVPNAGKWVLLCGLCMGAAVWISCFRYFRGQHKIMEDAISRITDYLSGNRDAAIQCNDEGELYRLFHEVNALVSILNAYAEEEEHTKRFLQDTLSDISHQLKTPLAALNVYNGIIQEETRNHPDVQRFSRLSEKELGRMEMLVQNLLKLAKLDAGAAVLEWKWENMASIAEEVREQFLFRAEQEGKEIRLSGGEEIQVFCDRNWIIEAVSNLVKNGLDHTERGNTVQIQWQMFAAFFQVTVKDNGSGIHPEDMHHIFKRFYRSRFSKDIQGIGLGLPLAKAIVEAHGGTIEVDSAVGRGTVFTMNFRIPTKL